MLQELATQKLKDATRNATELACNHRRQRKLSQCGAGQRGPCRGPWGASPGTANSFQEPPSTSRLQPVPVGTPLTPRVCPSNADPPRVCPSHANPPRVCPSNADPWELVGVGGARGRRWGVLYTQKSIEHANQKHLSHEPFT